MRSSTLVAHPSRATAPASPGPSPQIASLAGFRGARFWLLPGEMAAVVALVSLVLAVTPPPVRGVISTAGLMLSLLFATLCSFWMSRRAKPGREQWAWRCITLAEVGYVGAEALVFLLPTTRQTLPKLAGTALFFLPFYLLGAAAAILLPAVSTSGVKLVRVILDTCMIVGALLGLAFTFLIAPRLVSGTSVDVGIIIIPVVDVTALLTLVVLLVRGVQASYRPAFFWLAVGVLGFLCGDAALSYLTLPELHAYSPGLPFVDPFWIAGALALSLAPLSLLTQGHAAGAGWGWMERISSHISTPQRYQLLGQLLLLTTPVAVLFGLIAWAVLGPQLGAALPLALLTLGVMLLIILRQILIMRDLVDARVATERARQLEALKDQFITSVNHELRTPMMTMQGYIELLGDLQDQARPEKRAQMLERARRANTGLVQLLQSILEVRRIDQEAEDFVPQVVNVSAAVQDALSLLDPRAGSIAERKLIVQVPADLTIWGEAVRLQQMLTNLLSNAIKYSSPGTTIQVDARAAREKGPRLKSWITSSRQRSQVVEITVRDEGLGIPPEQIPLLFRRFVRLPRDLASKVRGTGLGLYLCRVFAEVMGGAVWVESTGVPGEGSTFHIFLPAPPVAPAIVLAPDGEGSGFGMTEEQQHP